MTAQLILTCEHAGNDVPAEYAGLFRGAKKTLQSHRGWDPGALELAKTFQRRLSAPLFFTKITRLLVELNRSLGHPQLFSEFTAGLDQSAKQAVLDRYYHRHRNCVEAWIEDRLSSGGPVIHLMFHTFTPVLHGQTRNADVGLLYDPGRELEKLICASWRSTLKEMRPDLRVRRNYPYLGTADGFTTHLRRKFPADRYAGIELEINQLWPSKPAADWRRLQRDLVDSLRQSRLPTSLTIAPSSGNWPVFSLE